MRSLTFDPQTLNRIVYEVQKIEQDYQKAKEDYEILDESEKDLLATLKVEISSRSDVSQVEAEAQARTSQSWKDFKAGKYEAKKKYGQVACKYRHILRVMECVQVGISYNQTLLKHRVHGEIGK